MAPEPLPATDRAADLVKAEEAKGAKEKTEKSEQAERQIKLMLAALQQASKGLRYTSETDAR